MRYDKYLSRIQKFNKFVNFVYRIRFVLISAVSLTLVSVMTFEFTKGIVKIENFDKLTYVYGDSISATSSAFANSSEVQYKEVGASEWDTKAPIYPGEYEVRGVSKNGFGSETTSDPIKFTIVPKDVEISISESQITYGNLPKISASLFGTDKIDSYEAKYEDPFSKKTKAEVNKDSVVIVDKNGNDVTLCYNILPKQRELNILARPLTVSFSDKEIFYNSKPVEEPNGEITSGTLAANDVITFIDNEELHSDIGSYQYSKEVVIKNGDKDVTDMYSIHTNLGNLRIKKIPLTIYSLDYNETYNGKTLLENNAYQVKFECPNIIEGHKVNYTFEGDYELVKDSYKPLTTEAIFSVKVTDKENNDVTDLYEISKSYGAINVSKRDISVLFGSDAKLYDGVELSETLYSVTGDLLDGDIVKIDEDLFPKIVEPGYIENVVYLLSINNGAGDDVSDCYNINLVSGQLTVQKPHITFNMLSFGEITYDSTEHLLDQFELADDEDSKKVSDKFTFALAYPADICLKAGTYYSSNEILVSLDGVDVTDFFDISYNRIEAKIKPRPIHPNVFFVENSGTELTYDSYDKEVNVAFPEGEMLDNPYLGRSWVRDAKSYNLVDDLYFSVENSYGMDVTDCYEIVSANSVTINKKDIYVTLPSEDFVYDGQYHQVSLDYSQFIGDNAICDNDSLSEYGFIYESDVGDYSYSSDNIFCNCPDNYVFHFDEDEKTSSITKRDLTLDFEPFETTYNGKNQNVRFNIVEGSLASGDSIKNSYHDGTSYVSSDLVVKNKGTYTRSNFQNFFANNGNIVIVNSEGRDVTSNYNISDDFDNTTIKVNPFELDVTFIDKDFDKIYNGESYVFNDFNLSKALPEGQYVEVNNAYEAKRAGEYTNDYKAYIDIYDEYGTKVTGNYKLTYNYWQNTSINKADITVTFSDYLPTYDGKPFYSNFDKDYSSVITVTSGALFEGTSLGISYKSSRESIFISNTNLQDIVDVSLVNEKYADALNDYNISYVYGGVVDYQKRDVQFKGDEKKFTYEKKIPDPATLINLVGPYGDSDFLNRHSVEKDAGAVTVNGMYQGKYDLICDATKFHLKNKNAGNVNVDQYVNFIFDDVSKKVTIDRRPITVKEMSDVFNYGDKPKANEKFSITNLVSGDVLYLLDKDGNKEEVTNTKVDYNCIIDMSEKNTGVSFKYYKDNDFNTKEITEMQFKVYENVDGVLVDVTSSYKITLDKERAKRGHPIWIK